MNPVDRRIFLRRAATAGAALTLGLRRDALARVAALPGPNGAPADVAQDEDFWAAVRSAFDLESGLINLNNGLSPSPHDVHAHFVAELEAVNRAPTLHGGDWPAEGRREEARIAAAAALGCTPEELAITRSATEAIQIAQLGIDLEPGDEVLTTREDYWAMWSTWHQRVRREGIAYREIDLGAPYPPDGEIVARFAAAITPRTRVILFCHVTWVTGHVLPVREICALARERGIQTIVDGAHGFAHIPFRVSDLGCDYYGTSGHKWLHAPLGTGLLYVRRDRIRGLWPLTPCFDEQYGDDIRKFEFVGSRAPAHHNAIERAVRFLDMIGSERKAARLRYLTLRWAERLQALPRVHLVTDLSSGRCCGLASFHVDGLESAALAAHLLERHRILVLATDPASYSGPPAIRVAPNVYTSTAEIDAFADAVEGVMATGLS